MFVSIHHNPLFLQSSFVFFNCMDKYEALSPVYLSGCLRSITFRNQLQSVRIASLLSVISAGNQYVYPVTVPLPNTVLCWDFSSSYYDIDFTVKKGCQDKDSEVIMEMKTYSPDTRHHGEICISECGTFYLIWDNTRSWLREKRVTFSVCLKVSTALPEIQTLCSSYEYIVSLMK